MNIILSATLSLQLLTVSMAPNAPFVTPGAVAQVSGVEWTPYVYLSSSLDGESNLGGFSVTLGGYPCGVRSVNSRLIVFIVPEQIEPGTRTLVVTTPTGIYSSNVEIRAFHPILTEQGGYVVATSAATMFPLSYLNGEPVPVSPMTWNLMSLQTLGLQGGVNATVILDGPEHYEIPARVHQYPVFPGITNAFFIGPMCANGTYSARVRVEGVTSEPVPIRFTSKCEVYARPERAARGVR